MDSDPEDIYAWQRLDARTTTSGRLVPEDIRKLAKAGVAHVINLAVDGMPGALNGEARLLADARLRYTHIPVPFDAPEDSHFEAFKAAYEADGEPVHVHCIANYRVSAFFYRYNRDILDMAEGEARALMERQWSPESSDYAEVWAPFIAKRD